MEDLYAGMGEVVTALHYQQEAIRETGRALVELRLAVQRLEQRIGMLERRAA